MSRHCPLLGIAVSAALAVLAGCQPQQPFYFGEDGDLSHYLGAATEIEYPDAEVESLAETTEAVRPFSLDNSQPKEIWDLSLEDAIHYALANSKVIRTLGGQPLQMRQALLRSPEGIPTVYDPAIAETDPRGGVEAALSAFDAQLTSSLSWDKNDSPRNTIVIPVEGRDIFPRVNKQDLGSFQAQLMKTAATGGTWAIRHNVAYTWSVGPRLYPSDWNVNVEGEVRQPLLQGAGEQFNRIAGPGATPGLNNGVMMARINTDVALTRFEAGVRDLVSDVENAYWELYFAYRHLDAMITGRDFALGYWRNIDLGLRVGTKPAFDEAQARDEYLSFRSLMESALSDLYTAENNLRLVMGLAATDGRLIRPSDEPKTARVTFDWGEILAEGLVRSVELREQKWMVKQQELALIAAKNYLLPRLDAVARYRWLGMGDDLIQPSGGTGNPFVLGSNAYQSMTSGDFQEWHMGFELSIPLGFRQEMAGVRNAQLKLARERARLQDQELAISHELAAAIRQLETAHVLTQTNFNRRIAAKKQVEIMQISYDNGKVTLDRVLDAQRRLAQAENDYYRSLVDYNEAIAKLHYRKGSLLEYNDVYLSEGPWPGKAYFDARRLARARDAGLYIDYGYTRPKVISRGAYQQQAAGPAVFGDEGKATGEALPEPIPTPLPQPVEATAEPPGLKPADGPNRPSTTAPPAPEAEASAASGPQIGPALASAAGVSPVPPAAPARLAAAQTKATVTRKASMLQSLELGRPAGNLSREKSSAAGWPGSSASEPPESRGPGGSSTNASRRCPSTPATRGGWSTVKPTGGDEPAGPWGIDDPPQTETQAAPLKWSNPKGWDTRHEALAHPPAAETDRPAASGAGIQR